MSDCENVCERPEVHGVVAALRARLAAATEQVRTLTEVTALTGDLTPEVWDRLSRVQGYIRCGDPLPSPGSELLAQHAAERHALAMAVAEEVATAVKGSVCLCEAGPDSSIEWERVDLAALVAEVEAARS